MSHPSWKMSIYCSDTFDENTPPVDDPDYISSLGATIFKGMQSADSDAVWLMQVKKLNFLVADFPVILKSLNFMSTGV